MAKDLLYRPDLSYDKSYYTDGNLYNSNIDENLNDREPTDGLHNKLENIDNLLEEIKSKLPVIPDNLLDVFLPSFGVVHDVLKDYIDNPASIPEIPIKPEHEIIIKPDIELGIIPGPEGTLPPSDPFGIEEDITINIELEDIPTATLIERKYVVDLTDILYDYLIKYNNTLDKYIAEIMTSLSVSNYGSLDMIVTKDLKDRNLSHLTDYLTKSKIGLKQQLNLYFKMFDMDETIFHIRSVKVAKEQLKRYKSNKKLKDENLLTKSANDLLRESILVAEKKYEENFYGLYKYLNSSVILFNECTNTITKQKQALVLLNNREREK
jgi:uncharacterized protein YfkK (UPF0435 family)